MTLESLLSTVTIIIILSTFSVFILFIFKLIIEQMHLYMFGTSLELLYDRKGYHYFKQNIKNLS